MSGAQVTNSPRTLTYDTKGNMTTDDRGCGMTWDFDNMLQSFAANGVTDLKNATYEYDAIGRRVAKNVGETGGTQTTVFVQAGQQVTCEYTPGNATTDCDRKYAYGTYIDEVLSFVDATTATEVRYWLSQNRQYSLYATTTMTGSATGRFHYDGYGQMRLVATSTSSAFPICITFTGRTFDNESSLIHLRSRQYLPRYGRFFSSDELVYVDGANRYPSYFLLKNVDPDGHACQSGRDCQKSIEHIFNSLQKTLDDYFGPGDAGKEYELKNGDQTIKWRCKKPKTKCCPAVDDLDLALGIERSPACKKCDQNPDAGGYFANGTIVICEGGQSSGFEQTVLHELQHAIDRCVHHGDWGDSCYWDLCTEISAYKNSGACSDGQREPGYPTEDDCLKAKALQSLRLFGGRCYTKGKAILDGPRGPAVFNFCKNKRRPYWWPTDPTVVY
jgi:RHS repeat-associated protein